jgi:hypothetical protein
MGLASHAIISRVISGRKAPSLKLLIALCEALRVEGRRREIVIGGLAPMGIADRLLGATSRNRPNVDDSPSQSNAVSRTARRTANTRFFFDVHAPLVFEALKVLGPCDVATLASGFTGPLSLEDKALERALAHLVSLGYVVKDDGPASQRPDLSTAAWRVVDRAADVVIPSRVPSAAALENVRTSLRTALSALPLEGRRLARTSLSTVKVPASGKAIDALRTLVVAFHDDVLDLQGPDDDAVVQVVVSVVELARRPCHAEGQARPGSEASKERAPTNRCSPEG